MVRPSHPCAPPLRGEHQHPTPSRRAERAACRRYAIMVSPTQSVPEVLAVWGSDYKKAIVCRRYTIMVAQPHHNHHTSQIPHITNPITIPTTHHHHPRPYHYRVPPARCSFHSPPHRPTARHRHNPHHKLTSPLPLTSYLLPLTPYPTEHKKGRHPVAPPHILTSIANLSYFTITLAAVPAVRTM